MDGLRRANALQTVAARSGAYAVTRFSIAYTEEVKPTGSVSNPYSEFFTTRRSTTSAGTSPRGIAWLCTVRRSEIFRFQHGLWVY